MDCERKGCAHPLAVHDPCSAPRCLCAGYEPGDRKARAALITDVDKQRPPTLAELNKKGQKELLDSLRADEARRFGGIS